MEIRLITFRISDEFLIKTINAQFEFELPFRLDGFLVECEKKEIFLPGSVVIRSFPLPMKKELFDTCFNVLAHLFKLDLPSGDYTARYERDLSWPVILKKKHSVS